MATWEEIRDEMAGMLADGKPLEDVIAKLEKRKNEMAKANLLKAMDGMKKPKQMTNEEWFTSLSTEEKAKWMAKHMSFCEVCKIQTCRGDGCQRFDREMMTEEDAFREWLKEVHT